MQNYSKSYHIIDTNMVIIQPYEIFSLFVSTELAFLS